MGFLSKLFRRDSNRHWAQFDGQIKTAPVLRQKASAFAPLFIELTRQQVIILRDSILTVTQDVVDVDNFFFEWIVVSLHIVDRLALDLLGPEKRNQFLKPFEDEVIEQLALAQSEAARAEATRIRFRELLQVRIPEYQHYDVALRDNQNGDFDLYGSLGWKFAENVGITDPALSVVVIQSVGEQLRVLSVAEFPQLVVGY